MATEAIVLTQGYGTLMTTNEDFIAQEGNRPVLAATLALGLRAWSSTLTFHSWGRGLLPGLSISIELV